MGGIIYHRIFIIHRFILLFVYLIFQASVIIPRRHGRSMDIINSHMNHIYDFIFMISFIIWKYSYGFKEKIKIPSRVVGLRDFYSQKHQLRNEVKSENQFKLKEP